MSKVSDDILPRLSADACAYPPEGHALRLLLRVLAGTLPVSEAVVALRGLGVSPSRLLRMMAAHGIGGRALPGGLLEGVLDGPSLALLRASDRMAAAWNLRLFEAQRPLDVLLSGAGRPYRYAKGVLLGWRFHGDLTTRASCDIDVMVRPADVACFRGLLRTAGYEEVHPFPEGHPRYGLWLNREAVFRSPPDGGVPVHVELQWSPVLPFYRMRVDPAGLLEGGRQLRLGGVDWPVPDDEVQLTVLLLHHGVTDGWRSLRHVLDLALFLRRMGAGIDWTGYRRRLDAMGLYHHAAAGFGLCRSLTGVEVPACFGVSPALLRRLEATLLTERQLTRDQRSWPFLRRQWLLAGGLRGRARLILGQLQKGVSPGQAELEGFPLPAGLFPAYYLLKPLRPLWRPFLTRVSGGLLPEKGEGVARSGPAGA